jgi:uncharacterized membrane protein
MRSGGFERVNFETSKNIGGVGGILMFVGIFPYISVYGLTELVGAILLLIAMKGFADYYKEAGIFNNALYSIIAGIVGAAAAVGIALVALVDFFTTVGITFGVGTISDWTTQISGIDWQNVSMNIFGRFIGYIILAFVIVFVVMLVFALLLRKSLSLLSRKSGVGLFGTTGTVLLIGAALVIAFGIGLILIWISGLLVAVAFFQMKPPPVQYVSPPPPQNVTQV